MTPIEFLTAASSIATCVSLLYVARQLADARKFKRSEVITQIDADYAPLTATVVGLEPGSRWGPDKPGPSLESEDDKAEVERLVAFIERITFLIDSEAVELKTIDDLFGYRFFIVMHNPHIQRLALRRFPDYYGTLFRVYAQWRANRKRLGSKVPAMEFALELVPEIKDHVVPDLLAAGVTPIQTPPKTIPTQSEAPLQPERAVSRIET